MFSSVDRDVTSRQFTLRNHDSQDRYPLFKNHGYSSTLVKNYSSNFGIGYSRVLEYPRQPSPICQSRRSFVRSSVHDWSARGLAIIAYIITSLVATATVCYVRRARHSPEGADEQLSARRADCNDIKVQQNN